MITSVVLSLLLAALTGGINPVQHSEAKGINPVQHSEAKSSTDTAEQSKGINPVQHSE